MTTADVVHGKPRIEGARVGVFQTGELLSEQGWSFDDAAEEFDLDAEQVRAVLEYYEGHPELMDTLRKQRTARRQSVASESRAG